MAGSLMGSTRRYREGARPRVTVSEFCSPSVGGWCLMDQMPRNPTGKGCSRKRIMLKIRACQNAPFVNLILFANLSVHYRPTIFKLWAWRQLARKNNNGRLEHDILFCYVRRPPEGLTGRRLALVIPLSKTKYHVQVSCYYF